jgi:hypothetical protein
VATAERRQIQVTRLALLFVLGAVGLGCDRTVVFACETRDDCIDGRAGGVCESDGYCSFPDGTCESGRRYGEYAPPALASTCTPVPDADPGVFVDMGESSSSSSSPIDSTGTPRLPADEDDTSSGGSEDDGASEPADTTRAESSSGGDDTDGGVETSSTGDDGEPKDCDALDCGACMDCVDEPSGPCEDERTACTDANGCTSGVACMQECTLYGSCFDDCCPGDVGTLVDELILCAADHCIEACGEYEFLTCG